MHDVKNFPVERINTKHYFDVLSFGDEFPNQLNPLEKRFLLSNVSDEEEIKNLNKIDPGTEKIIFNDVFDPNLIAKLLNDYQDYDSDSLVYNYYLKIVPTIYEYLDGRVINNTYQYSVTKSIAKVNNNNPLPGVFVNYELSPIMIKFKERSRSFSHFLTGCCAIVGGVFTIAGMFDSFSYHYYNMYKKYKLNKLG
jgi:hypothetical protein